MGALRDELLETLGPEGLAALSLARGGRRAYIPRSIRAGHWLVEAVGLEAAKLLAFQFGGCRIDVPRGPDASRAARIRDLRQRGWSIARIASGARISERQVRNILRG